MLQIKPKKQTKMSATVVCEISGNLMSSKPWRSPVLPNRNWLWKPTSKQNKTSGRVLELSRWFFLHLHQAWKEPARDVSLANFHLLLWDLSGIIAHSLKKLLLNKPEFWCLSKSGTSEFTKDRLVKNHTINSWLSLIMLVHLTGCLLERRERKKK